MKIKIKISSIYQIFFILLILVNANIFLIKDWGFAFRIFSVLIVLVLFGITLGLKKTIYLFKKYKFMFTWILIFFLGMIICMLYINSVYHTSYSYMISQIYHYLYILLFWPIIYYLETDKNHITKLIKTILKTTVFVLLLKFLIWFFYNYLGLDIIHYMILEGGEGWSRNGHQRLFLPVLLCFLVAYSTMKIFCEKGIRNKFVHVLLLCISIAYIFVVYATKAMVVILICTFASIWIFKNRDSTKKKLAIIVLLIITIIAIYFGNIIELYIGSIDKWSIMCRQYALEYYMGLIKNYKLFGFSLVTESMELQNGWGGNYYFSDLGIVSKFFEFGFWGIIFFVPIIRIIYLSLKTKFNYQNCKVFLIGLVVYVVASSIISNDIYLYRNMLSFPFVIGVIEYMNKYRDVRIL
ncbi:hypothetical protein DW768_09480 [Ruminococcus sp. AM29-26]|nr:hypothetical protein DW768_09480 [Ruminococcus sp. AM29-26]